MPNFIRVLQRVALQVNGLALFGALLVVLFFSPHVYYATIANFALWYGAKLNMTTVVYGFYYLVVPSSIAFIAIDVWMFGKATFLEMERTYKLGTALLWVLLACVWLFGFFCVYAMSFDSTAMGICALACILVTVAVIELLDGLSRIE